ncbi:MAG TPA: response regulator transcription factor [Niabella sp.]|nr:response regulator transcription factor [Niabella sp.]HQX72523.1 response regulator transcription factor [Chitinophagaceae bacterium]HQW16288.1 response regulator transcription factor [Niabella sp.]HQX21480.1 response regulator transcription factor [Niabella sp.]HRB36106.1 response regulator transcription factor [Niabella sp.]
MKILIVEDEPDLARDIAAYLSGESYLCEFAANYEEALEKIDVYSYDCILLDIMLPGGTGINILEELRKQNKQDGVIIISAKNAIEDKIRGLQIGADDYLAKPFHLSELAARIHSLIRRKQFDTTNIITQHELQIDLLAKLVMVEGQEVPLTRKEFDLLLYFVSNKNRVISKAAIAEKLSGDLADMFDNYDFVYAHVKNLKRKLQEAGYGNYLKTIYGSGYKWEI